MPKIAKMSDKQLVNLIDKAIDGFEGQANDIEGAIGTLMFGRRLGWKPLLLMHDKKKIKKYEDILGLKFTDDLEELGDKASKSIAWNAAQKLSNFWKAVTGNIPDVRSNKIARG